MNAMRIALPTLLALALALDPALALVGVGVARADCPADLSGDQQVDAGDLAVVLSSWGTAVGDVTGDGTTNAKDLASILGAWGACPAAPIEWTLLTTTNGTATNAIDSTGAIVRSWTGAAGGARPNPWAESAMRRAVWGERVSVTGSG